MKKIFLFGLIIRIILLVTIIISYTIAVKAQSVAVNTTGTPADASAMLDIASTSKGFLAPRMTTAQRTGIISPANGLLVFDTDTKSYWYFSTSWKEINNASGGGSFSLPYAGSGSIADKIFSIANADSSNGATAIYGKSGNSGIGVIPGINMGVWGDNSRGIGILGTSVNGVGAYGLSFQNHGVSGYSTNSAFAGVYGSHANNGAGIMGEMSNSGMAVYGKSTGTNGKAGMFEATNSSFADSVLLVKNAGYGSSGVFWNTNTLNGNAVVEAVSNSTGDGFYAELNNTTNAPNAAFRGINNSLGGYGLYAESGLGISARLFNSSVANNSFTLDAKTNGTGAVGNFTIANAANNNNILQGSSTGVGGGLNLSLTNTSATGIGINLSHSGTGNGLVVAAKKGKAGVFSNTDATNSLTVLDVSNIGTNNTAIFTTNNTTNNTPAIRVDNNGTGRGVQSILSNVNNSSAAVFGSSAGNRGVEGFAQTYGVVGQSGASTGGIGVIGQSSPNSADGIGVKGISYSSVLTSGAVTAINNNDGVALYASTTGGANQNGVGIHGIGPAIGIHGISNASNGSFGYGVVGETGSNGGIGVAGKFISNNSNDPTNTLWALNYGSGAGLTVTMNNNLNNSAAIEVNHSGTGELLKLWGQNNAAFDVSNNANLTTTGTVTVKNNKGIVRNSTSTQLRVETLATPSAAVSNASVGGGGFISIPITFGTAFSSTPVVYIANISNQNLAAKSFLAVVTDVTTTGCNVILTNTTDGTVVVSGIWHLVAMGAE